MNIVECYRTGVEELYITEEDAAVAEAAEGGEQSRLHGSMSGSAALLLAYARVSHKC